MHLDWVSSNNFCSLSSSSLSAPAASIETFAACTNWFISEITATRSSSEEMRTSAGGSGAARRLKNDVAYLLTSERPKAGVFGLPPGDISAVTCSSIPFKPYRMTKQQRGDNNYGVQQEHTYWRINKRIEQGSYPTVRLSDFNGSLWRLSPQMNTFTAFAVQSMSTLTAANSSAVKKMEARHQQQLVPYLPLTQTLLPLWASILPL